MNIKRLAAVFLLSLLFLASVASAEVDNVPPTSSVNLDSNTWLPRSLLVISCQDLNSGCKQWEGPYGTYSVKYRNQKLPINACTPCPASFGDWEPFYPVYFSTNGQYHIEFYSEDNAGNVEEVKTFFLFVDQSLPTEPEPVLNGLGEQGSFDLTSLAGIVGVLIAIIAGFFFFKLRKASQEQKGGKN